MLGAKSNPGVYAIVYWSSALSARHVTARYLDSFGNGHKQIV